MITHNLNKQVEKDTFIFEVKVRGRSKITGQLKSVSHKNSAFVHVPPDFIKHILVINVRKNIPSGSPPAPAIAGHPPSAAAASSASPPSEPGLHIHLPVENMCLTCATSSGFTIWGLKSGRSRAWSIFVDKMYNVTM